MKIFMLGWEFPPYISGGLGTACYGLTKAMNELGLEVTFVLPKSLDGCHASHVRLIGPSQITTSANTSSRFEQLKNVTFKTINSKLSSPYETLEMCDRRIEEIIQAQKPCYDKVQSAKTLNAPKKQVTIDYGHNLISEVYNYAASALEIAKNENFDIIHAHDWMTYPAAVAVAALSKKPLVVHVHSTEFDRSGEHVNQEVYDIERMGMQAADRIIAVSHLTKNIIMSRYSITGSKVAVVYNGVESNSQSKPSPQNTGIKKDEKIVLFLGRITMQKGPEYFLQAAKKVLEVAPDTKFVMAGSGDMMRKVVEMSAALGIGDKVLFTGFLRGKDVERIYKMADLYVMPSVSEPFGIAPLEALNHDVPVLISKQSGVSEVLTHVLKVDFWDIESMANKIIAVLRYQPLQMTLRKHGNFEVRKLKWIDAARKCSKVYNQTLMQEAKMQSEIS